MSTPAPVRPAREAPPPPRVPVLAEAPARRPRLRPSPAIVLAAIYAVAAAYHAIQGTMHVTPAVFTDELLHGGLARAFAEGTPFEIRDATAFFPSFLPALVGAPAWLIGDMETAYATAKVVNALVMSAACFPAYWLARQLVRPSYALLAAAATVAAPGMMYSSYLLTSPVAYPVFLLTMGVYVRTLARPSPRWLAAAGAVSLLAVGCRMQFAALPLVFSLLLVVRRGPRTRIALPALGLVAVGALAALGGTRILGQYAGLLGMDVDPGAAFHWALATAELRPYGAGLAVVPGAVLGLALAAVRPRSAVEAGFARLTIGIALAFFTLVGVVAAGQAERPLGRYVIYLTPLVVIAFFVFAERGFPHRVVYAVLAAGLASLGWLVPFSSLADNRFSFDSATLSAYGQTAAWLGHANAATIFAVVPLLVAVGLIWRPRAARAAAAAAIAVMLAVGATAYVADHAMTQRARAAWAASPPDWLDAGGYGSADFLGLPGGAPYFAWTFEAWNRGAGRPIWLDAKPPSTDPWPSGRASVADDGTLLVDGKPNAAGLLAVSDHATQIGLEGSVLARPRNGLTLMRVPAGAHVASLARGVYFDGWASGNVRFRTWPGDSPQGVYRVALSLPAGLAGRIVSLEVEGGARRLVRLEGGASVEVELPARDPAQALRITSDRAELLDGSGANPRLVSFRVDRLEFVPVAGARRTGLLGL
jgi:hypothetical protein